MERLSANLHAKYVDELHIRMKCVFNRAWLAFFGVRLAWLN